MARKPKLNVGVIGLGIIGSRIAVNLRTAGFQVYVWNRTPKPAPNFLASAAEVAGICDVLQLVVADSVALFSIIDSISDVLAPRHTVICSATVGAEATVEAARMVEASGAKFLDAPFTGSKGAAEKGELVYYIGGDDKVFENVEPVLKASSKTIVKIGAIGHAATVKIATNMIAAVTVQTLAEACVIVKKSGVDLQAFARALEPHGVRSGLIDMKLPMIIGRDYETNFSVKHMFKDVQLAIQVANSCDIDIPATTATAGVLYGSINNGWADMDYAAIARFYEDAAPAPAPAANEEEDEDGESPATEPASPDITNGEPEEVENPPGSGGEVPPSSPVASLPETVATEPASAPVAPAKKALPPVKTEKSKSWFTRRREA